DQVRDQVRSGEGQVRDQGHCGEGQVRDQVRCGEEQEIVSCRLRLRIVPNAKRSEVVGPHGDALKLKIAAPALEGRANEELVEFLANKLGVSRRTITL